MNTAVQQAQESASPVEIQESSGLSGGSGEFDMAAALESMSDVFGKREEPTSDADDIPADELADPPAEAAEEPTPEPAPAPVVPKHEFPKTWKKDLEASWATLPPEVQEEIARRESDMFTGLEQYRGAAQAGRTFTNLLTPFLPDLQAAGIAPETHVQNLLQAHHILTKGSPEQKEMVVRALLEDVGLPYQGQAEAPYVDPAVANLQQQFREVTTQLQQQRQLEATRARAEVQKTLDAFFSDPANEYAETVAPIMTRLLQSGTATDLKSAYDQAVWLDPTVRAKVLAAQRATEEEAARVAATKKAEEAKKAASANVKSGQKSAGSTAKRPSSIDDTLAETFKKINSR